MTLQIEAGAERIAGRRMPWAVRSLGLFWGVVVVAAAVGGGALQAMGPLPPARSPGPVASATPKAGMVAEAVTPVTVNAEAKAVAVARPAAVAQAIGTIAAPVPALLEPSKAYPGSSLPTVAADGRTPLQAYAAAFPRGDIRPRVAILVAGVGMNDAESRAAIENLPASVSLAVTPYAARLDAVLDSARAHGHELLVSIPMEPQGFPLNDPGNRALLTGAAPEVNAQRLEWALSRFSGYVGATGAMGDMRGERFAAATDAMLPLLETLAGRGLLYVDPRPNAMRLAVSRAPKIAFRGVNLVLDDPGGAAELDRSLARLEQIGRDRGSALGLVGRPSPVAVDRIAVWAAGLPARGMALAPVSVLAQMPAVPAPPYASAAFTVPSPPASPITRIAVPQ